MQPTYQKQSQAKLIATIATIIIIAGVIIIADHLKAQKSSTAATPTSTSTSQPTDTSGTSSSTGSESATTSTSGASSYKDGTYTASSDYYVPHGYEDIKVSLTLQNGVITSSAITNSEGDRDSAAFQEDFASAYKSYVVGKKISDVQLGIIAGASDTTQGFNDALNQIATKAQA